MLELLASPLLVTIAHRPVVDLFDVREAVDDERAEEHRVRDLVSLDRQAHQTGQRLQLRNLDEAVNVIVLKEQTLQFLEALQLGNVGWADDVVEAHILERDLLNRLLEVQVVKHLQGVAVYEKFIITFDLCVTRLDETLGAGLLPTFVAVKAKSLDTLHFILPLLADDLQEALRADILLLIVISVAICVLPGAALRRSIVIGLLRARCGGIHVGIII